MIIRRCIKTFWSCDAPGSSISIMWGQWHDQWRHYICLVKIIKMRFNIGTGVGITWCQWHHKWYHCIPKTKMIKMIYDLIIWSCDTIMPAMALCDADIFVKGTTASLTSRQFKYSTTWPFGYLMTLTLRSV